MCQQGNLSGIVEHTYSPRGKAFEWQNDYDYDYNLLWPLDYDHDTILYRAQNWDWYDCQCDWHFLLATRNSGLVATLETTFNLKE